MHYDAACQSRQLNVPRRVNLVPVMEILNPTVIRLRAHHLRGKQQAGDWAGVARQRGV
jgi:hypothetical protein